MATIPAPSRDFEIGRVIGRTFSNIAQNWLTLTIIGAAVAMMSMIMGTIMMGGLTETAIQVNPFLLFQSSGYWMTIAGGAVLNAFALSAIFSVLLGRQGADLSDALVGAFRFLLPMFALVTIWSIGFGIGMMLLFVPGIIFATIWSVSAPALVAENAGVFGAFGRSRALTSGIRWKVFGALIIFSIVFCVIIFAVQGLGGGSLALYSGNPIAFVMGTISATISTLATPSFLAALYVETLNAKEGGAQSELAEVFS